MMYFSKITKLSYLNTFRFFSVTSKKPEFTNVRKSSLNIGGNNSVIVSESSDIFRNLALEDWLYTNCDLSATNCSILLMWCNRPSVVIGRHQNPWVECSYEFCVENGIEIARRNSGGGTVYHDFGNLNLSFLTSRKDYDRKKNLEIICESINRRWGINLNISKRHDILYNDQYKVSGTASKLGRINAYHHCTVLVNVDKTKLQQALHRNLEGVESKATSSIRAEVINLRSVCSKMDTVEVIESVKRHYKQLHKVEDDHIFQINPSEQIFPGIHQIEEGLRSWEWCFGHTPRFTVTRLFELNTQNFISNVEFKINVNKGKIEAISVHPQILSDESYDALKQCIISKPFSFLIHNSLTSWMKCCDDKMLSHTVKDCIFQMVLDVLR